VRGVVDASSEHDDEDAVEPNNALLASPFIRTFLLLPSFLEEVDDRKKPMTSFMARSATKCAAESNKGKH
jgi:hypothetical protein